MIQNITFMNFNFQKGQRVFWIDEAKEAIQYGTFEQEHHGLAVVTDDKGKERIFEFEDIRRSTKAEKQAPKINEHYGDFYR